MKNIFTSVTVFHASTFDFERMFSEAYGITSLEITELNNDTSYEFNNIKREPLDEYEQNTFNDIIKTGICEEYQVRLLLRALCNDKKIPEGNYILRSSW